MPETAKKPTLRKRIQALKFKLAILKATLKASKKARTGFIYMAYCTIIGTGYLIKYAFVYWYITVIIFIALMIYNLIVYLRNKKQNTKTK